MTRIHKTLLATVALLALGTSQVVAADLEAPVEQGYDWSGPYFGLKFGGAVDGETDFTVPAGAGAAGLSGEADLDGVLGGTQGGYNFQHGNIVFGIDNDFAGTDIDGTAVFAGAPNGSLSVDIDTLSTARGRIGYAFDRILPYATGGVAYGAIDIIDPVLGSDDEFAVGFTVGGGVEWAFRDGWHARIEYNFVDLGTESAFGGAVSADIEEIHLVRAGVSVQTRPILNKVLDHLRTLRGN